MSNGPPARNSEAPFGLAGIVVQASVGAWSVMKKMDKAQLQLLMLRCDVEWVEDSNKVTGEQLEWLVAVGKRLDEIKQDPRPAQDSALGSILGPPGVLSAAN